MAWGWRFLGVVFAVSLFAASLPASAMPENAQKDEQGYYAAGRILVKGKPGLSEDRFLNILARRSGILDRKIKGIDVAIVRVPPGLEKKVVEALQQDASIDFAELDRLIPPTFIPNDPSFSSQWHHTKIGSAAAWDGASAAGITIAILDSGTDGNHPDLAPVMVPGWNSVSQNTDTADINGHGTATAGTAAAAFNNSVGVAGVAREAKIMPVRITNDSTGAAYWSDISNGAVWAVDHGARVISNSYEAWNSGTLAKSTSDYVRSKGGLFVAAAGNSSSLISGTSFPDTSMIVVSATDSTDTKTSWSNYGPIVDVSAPGVDIYTTMRGGSYGKWWGTSFSTPMTAGLIALIMGVNPQFSPNDVENILESSAVDLGTPGKDDYYGNGRISASAAIALAHTYQPAVTDTQAPTASITSPAANATVNGIVPVNVNASDNVGVTKVDLYVNGAFYASDTAAPYSFSWDTTPLGNANVTLTAKAFDAAGNQGASAGVAVKVQNTVDTTPPVVSFTSPASGATVSGTVTVKATASDNAGVASMTLLIDGNQVASSVTGSVSYNWNTRKVKAGSHTLKATATDTSGNVSEIFIVVYR